MSLLFMSLEDYKEFFCKNTVIEEADYIKLEIEGIENKNDKEYEYSIKWKNIYNEENGIKYAINTSSIFSFNMCNWETREED